MQNPFLKHQPEQTEHRINVLAHSFYSYMEFYWKQRGLKIPYIPDEETFEKAMDLSLVSIKDAHGPFIKFIDVIACFEKFTEFLLRFQTDGLPAKVSKEKIRAAILTKMKAKINEIIIRN